MSGLFLKGVAVAVFGVALAQSHVILAQSTEPDLVIKARQANERELGGGYTELKDELAKKKPLQFLVGEYAGQLESLAKDAATWYPAGSGPESGAKTNAKAEIWTKRAEFDELYKKFLDESVKLNQIAVAEDNEGLKVQLKVLSERCIACHDKFKERHADEMVF